MNFIELKDRFGTAILFDLDSQWEIRDAGEYPAHWSNYRDARNMDAVDTYATIRERLARVSPMLSTGLGESVE